MFIKTENGVADGDLDNLKRLFAIIDAELSLIDDRISMSTDAESDGLFEMAEYFLGIAFTAIQHYIASTYDDSKIKKGQALDLPPHIDTGITFARIFNAGANFWKHQDEWGIRANVERDISTLSLQAQKTIEAIEALTPWDDYTLINLVAYLTKSKKLHMSVLLPQIVLWRDAVDSLNAQIVSRVQT